MHRTGLNVLKAMMDRSRAGTIGTMVLGLGLCQVALGGNNTEICHWADGQGYILLSINEHGADAHIGVHGDVYAAPHYADADGDGFGDAAVPTGSCPSAGSVTIAGDCDDSNAGTNPGAAEVCGDGVDNDCDVQVDEDCQSAACPCYDLTTLLGSMVDPYTSGSCSDAVAGGTGLRLTTQRTSGRTLIARGVAQGVDGDPTNSCSLSHTEGGETNTTSFDDLTDEEVGVCLDLIEQAAVELGLTCPV